MRIRLLKTSFVGPILRAVCIWLVVITIAVGCSARNADEGVKGAIQVERGLANAMPEIRANSREVTNSLSNFLTSYLNSGDLSERIAAKATCTAINLYENRTGRTDVWEGRIQNQIPGYRQLSVVQLRLVNVAVSKIAKKVSAVTDTAGLARVYVRMCLRGP